MLFNILKIHNHETTKGIEKTNKRNQKKKKDRTKLGDMQPPVKLSTFSHKSFCDIKCT